MTIKTKFTKLIPSIIILILIIINTSAVLAQEPKSVKKQKETIEKAKEARKEQAEKAIEARKKRHLSIQDKKTRKRIKKNMKKSKGVNYHERKKKFFLFRLFQ
jgi:uncharacterized membrane protein